MQIEMIKKERKIHTFTYLMSRLAFIIILPLKQQIITFLPLMGSRKSLANFPLEGLNNNYNKSNKKSKYGGRGRERKEREKEGEGTRG